MDKNDLIYRNDLLAAYDAAHKGPPGGARKLMEEAPAVDAVPVKHGHIEIEVLSLFDGEDCYCSECGHWSLLPDYKWCPYCGTKFDAPISGPNYSQIGGAKPIEGHDQQEEDS